METEKTASPASHSRTSRQETAPSRRKPRVLLAEDNQVNRLVAAEMLEFLGYEVDMAIDGRKAVEAVEQRIHALILMDCQMPEMDGYEASRQIRADESNRGLARKPIVAITGNAAEEEREKCLAAGMDDHLAKPFTMGELKEICGKWISA